MATSVVANDLRFCTYRRIQEDEQVNTDAIDWVGDHWCCIPGIYEFATKCVANGRKWTLWWQSDCFYSVARCPIFVSRFSLKHLNQSNVQEQDISLFYVILVIMRAFSLNVTMNDNEDDDKLDELKLRAI